MAPPLVHVDPVLGPFATIPAAHAAARTGDMIELVPATYGSSGSTYNLYGKGVHLKGIGTDPAAVKLDGLWTYRPDPSNDYTLFEGFTFSTSGYNDSNLRVSDATWPSARVLHLNRCVVGKTTGTLYAGIDAYTAVNARLRLTNCTLYGNYDIRLRHFQPGAVELVKCYIPSGLDADQLAMCSVADYVTTPTAGYGAGYGIWYGGEVAGDSYDIPGQVLTPPGYSPGDYRIDLYRVQADGTLEQYRWRRSVPDGETGAFVFDLLPRLRQDGQPQAYQVVWSAPAGLPPGAHGPYIPVPG